MLPKLIALKLFSVIFFIFVSCQKQEPNWPRYIVNSMWVPREAQAVTYYTLEGSYQVKYRVNICYPGTKFIETIVSEMAKRRWKRLDFDFLNPKIKLNHGRGQGGTWSRFSDRDGNNIAQWIEDWEDPPKNIVRYGLKYQGKDKIAENTCSLEVVVVYIPAEILIRK